MKVVDLKKTEELLKGLDGDVQVENIDKYLQERGVIVEASIGRMRIPITIDYKMFAIDINENKDLNEFFNEHIKNSKLVFISKQKEKKLQSIETSIRQKITALSLGYNKKYLSIDRYKEFKTFFDKKKIEYLNVKDEILENWDVTLNEFLLKLDNSLSQLRSLDKEEIKKSILSKIPKKNEYENSFKIELKLKAFPVMANLNLFDKEINNEIKKSILDDNTNSIYEIIATPLNNAFVTLNKLYKYYAENDVLKNNQIKKINSLGCDISKDNLLKNSLVNEIVEDLKEVEKEKDVDTKFELIDVILAKIYKFADEVEILDKIDLGSSFFDLEVLKMMAQNI